MTQTYVIVDPGKLAENSGLIRGPERRGSRPPLNREKWPGLIRDPERIHIAEKSLPRCRSMTASSKISLASNGWMRATSAMRNLGPPSQPHDGRCWPAWHADLNVKAVAALAAIGIAAPTRAYPEESGT